MIDGDGDDNTCCYGVPLWRKTYAYMTGSHASESLTQLCSLNGVCLRWKKEKKYFTTVSKKHRKKHRNKNKERKSKKEKQRKKEERKIERKKDRKKEILHLHGILHLHWLCKNKTRTRVEHYKCSVLKKNPVLTVEIKKERRKERKEEGKEKRKKERKTERKKERKNTKYFTNYKYCIEKDLDRKLNTTV